MVAISRRALVSAAASLAMAMRGDDKLLSSKSSISDFICSYAPLEYRLAVAATGKFLYRGEDAVSAPNILAPDPDLLLPGTYDDEGAIDYFQCLEKRLSTITDARPSLGHIATSDQSEASQWGEAVSVWPLGDKFSYVWPEKERLFFPTESKCESGDFAINRDLEGALELGHEVLFSSSFDKPASLPSSISDNTISAFLAVPSTYNSIIQELMKQNRFRDINLRA